MNDPKAHRPLTQKDLHELRCDREHPPGETCGETLYFHGKCHIEAATYTRYERGNVIVSCAICERTIATIKVAP